MGKRVGFMFAGQGAQAVGMGRDLAESSAAARALFEQADRSLGRDISRLCFNGPLDELTASANCQPAVYIAALACLAAVRECVAVEPVVCAGLSLGEFAALAAAGALDVEAGLHLVARRGELMAEACRRSAGAMAAVLNADAALLERICREHGIDVANVNCPGQTVISGERARVQAAAAALAAAGVARVIMLQVDGAFHSRLMAPAADAFVAVLAAAEFRRPRCPVAQNVVGALVEDPEALRANLARQVTGSVRWEASVRAMLEVGVDVLVEFGPGQVLSGFMRRIDRTVPVCNVAGAADVAKACEMVA